MTSSSSSRDFLRVGQKMLKIRKRKKAPKQFPDGGEKIWRQKTGCESADQSDASVSVCVVYLDFLKINYDKQNYLFYDLKVLGSEDKFKI